MAGRMWTHMQDAGESDLTSNSSFNAGLSQNTNNTEMLNRVNNPNNKETQRNMKQEMHYAEGPTRQRHSGSRISKKGLNIN